MIQLVLYQVVFSEGCFLQGHLFQNFIVTKKPTPYHGGTAANGTSQSRHVSLAVPAFYKKHYGSFDCNYKYSMPISRDSNSPISAGNLLFSMNVTGLPFSLSILPD